MTFNIILVWRHIFSTFYSFSLFVKTGVVLLSVLKYRHEISRNCTTILITDHIITINNIHYRYRQALQRTPHYFSQKVYKVCKLIKYWNIWSIEAVNGYFFKLIYLPSFIKWKSCHKITFSIFSPCSPQPAYFTISMFHYQLSLTSKVLIMTHTIN